MIHCYIELDRATTYLAVLYIGLVSDGAIDKDINALATIRAVDSSSLNLVHRAPRSSMLHTIFRQPGEHFLFRQRTDLHDFQRATATGDDFQIRPGYAQRGSQNSEHRGIRPAAFRLLGDFNFHPVAKPAGNTTARCAWHHFKGELHLSQVFSPPAADWPRSSSNAFATGSDDAGFWPVISWPSVTTYGCQSSALE